MRRTTLTVACVTTFACIAACTPDLAHTAVSLSPPYSEMPPAPPGTAIESGKRVALDARQQEAVVVGVAKWMKDPRTAQFGAMHGARNRQGAITVCGAVSGRNGGGVYIGMAPYIGVLMGTPTVPEFVVVGIAASGRERAEVASLCQESGVTKTG